MLRQNLERELIKLVHSLLESVGSGEPETGRFSMTAIECITPVMT